MLQSLVHLIASPMVWLWLNHSVQSWRVLPTPKDTPLAHAPGANIDKVLLVGSGVAAGYGVRSASLALGGHLARQLPVFTGRGASVETVTQPGMRMSRYAQTIESHNISHFDAVVVTLGTDEALRLVPVRRFRRDLGQLLNWVDTHAPPSVSVVFVGIPVVTRIMRMPWPLAHAVGRRCAALDDQLRAACGEHLAAIYTPFTPDAGDLLADSRGRAYAKWAALLAPGVARVLDAQLANPRDPSVIVESERQRALDDLGILDTGPDERFDSIVTSVRDLFGVAGASITFVDGGRQWTKASVGVDPADSPRGSSLGDATINNGKMLVVPDASVDPRFRGHPWVAGKLHVRFFAGFPIEAANGQRIGALCLIDSRPRAFSAAEGSLLGQFAMRVQGLLWGGKPAAR